MEQGRFVTEAVRKRGLVAEHSNPRGTFTFPTVFPIFNPIAASKERLKNRKMDHCRPGVDI
jgi:hypothetical protein